jgi:hypothetical protein
MVGSDYFKSDTLQAIPELPGTMEQQISVAPELFFQKEK